MYCWFAHNILVSTLKKVVPSGSAFFTPEKLKFTKSGFVSAKYLERIEKNKIPLQEGFWSYPQFSNFKVAIFFIFYIILNVPINILLVRP